MRIATIAAGVLLAMPLAAQTSAPPRGLALSPPASAKHLTIATSASVATVKPGGFVSLFIDVAPNQGIHVYAPGAKDYLPIAVKLDPHASVKAGKLIYPKSEILLFEPLGERVPTYQKPFRLTQGATIAGWAKPGTTVALTGTVSYQACDDKICYLPTAVPVKWTLNLAATR